MITTILASVYIVAALALMIAGATYPFMRGPQ
jgi:hypothetical protein